MLCARLRREPLYLDYTLHVLLSFSRTAGICTLLYASDDSITLTNADNGRLFVVRVLHSGEERVARYHIHKLAGRALRFPCFADPDNPADYHRWLHAGWAAVAVRRA